MGKKKKGKSSLRLSSFSSNNEFSSIQDEIIQHFQLLKESNGLVIGFNAVLRSIEKNLLSVIIYVSRRGTSAMYHGLNLMCKGKNVLLLQVQDINSNVFSSKIPTSTTYGIKKSSLHQPQFSKLFEKLDIVKNSRKNQKKKSDEMLLSENEEFCFENQSSCEDIQCPSDKNNEICIKNIKPDRDITSENLLRTNEIKCFVHPKHGTSKQKCTGTEGMLKFQEVDFPNYKTMFNQISISIK